MYLLRFFAASEHVVYDADFSLSLLSPPEPIISYYLTANSDTHCLLNFDLVTGM